MTRTTNSALGHLESARSEPLVSVSCHAVYHRIVSLQQPCRLPSNIWIESSIEMEPTKCISQTDLRSGDVLLCYSPEFKGKCDELLSGYSHAAICLGDCRILEATEPKVRETSVPNLLASYSHIAVLRSSNCWSYQRIAKLWNFAEENIGKNFNNIGVGRVSARRTELIEEADERLQAYFETGATIEPNRSVYFCSELVAAALISIGVIHESAASLFDPKALSPEDIGRDAVFGLFIGYIVSNESSLIPETDMFFNSLL